MKKTFIFLACSLVLGFTATAQEGDSLTTASIALPQDRLYILEDVEKYRSARTFPMDDNDSYLQVLNGYVILSYRSRGQNGFASGPIHSSSVQEVQGEEIITFTIISDGNFNSSKGSRYFFGIKNTSENRFIIYQLDNMEIPMLIFNAHGASAKEKTQLTKRSSGLTNY